MGLEAITLQTIAAISAAGVGAIAAISSGQQAKETASDNAEIARRNAAQDKDSAIAQAEKIRRVAAIQKSQANAGLAASGVSLGEGTAVKINEEITKNSEQDAYTAILNGSRSANASLQQASMFDSKASNALNSSYLNAGSSLLSAGAKIGKGWKQPGGTGYRADTQLMWGND